MKLNFLVLILGLTMACGQTTQKPPVRSLASLETKVDSLVGQWAHEDTPGVAVLVAYDGEPLISKGYGNRDMEAKQEITPTTNMRMASVSKQFTALTVLTLVEAGKLTLEDPVINYLPYPIFEGITINHLLRHTSGLPDYYAHFDQNWPKTDIVENQDILDWLKTDPGPEFQPGEQWSYSNTAYLMLAVIVEKVSGMEFSNYAQSMVFQPLGMDRTQYFNLAVPVEIDERARCYGKKGDTFQQVDGFFMNGIMGDGAVYTNLTDYLNYDQMLRKKAVFSESTYDLIHQPGEMAVKNSGDSIYYAMGWFVDQDRKESSHSGGWFGTNTYVYRGLETPLTIALFCNATDLMPMKSVALEIRSMAKSYLAHAGQH